MRKLLLLLLLALPVWPQDYTADFEEGTTGDMIDGNASTARCSPTGDPQTEGSCHMARTTSSADSFCDTAGPTCGTASGTACVSFWFRQRSQPTGGVEPLRFQNSTTVLGTVALLATSNTLQANGVTFGTTSASTWHRIRCEYVKGTGADGIFRCNMDGGTIAGVTNSAATVDFARLETRSSQADRVDFDLVNVYMGERITGDLGGGLLGCASEEVAAAVTPQPIIGPF